MCRFHTPAGIFKGSRSIFLGVFRAFHFDTALCNAGKAGLGTNLPLPGCGLEFLPHAHITSPLDNVYLGCAVTLKPSKTL